MCFYLTCTARALIIGAWPRHLSGNRKASLMASAALLASPKTTPHPSQSLQQGKGRDAVYVAAVPLRVAKGPVQMLMSAAYSLGLWDLQHFMVIIKPNPSRPQVFSSFSSPPFVFRWISCCFSVHLMTLVSLKIHSFCFSSCLLLSYEFFFGCFCCSAFIIIFF